ncbi:uncharacterized protein LOC131066043 [Cryptomeria japonica]|uniref:uncharacterized protein LOC131066043 n=1 Tax=Cryptomeria japonica TaxID=3369 RepID=UPI0025ABC935|nr:uncharacterized protein LOC131066043 [Cryptomeria japonica]
MPIEFEDKTLRTTLKLNMTLYEAQKDRIQELNALDELRKMVVQQTKLIQNQRVKWHDKYIKENKFQAADWALLYDSRYKDTVGKFQTRWLGPYEIEEVLKNGAIHLTTINPVRFKLLVNGHRLHLYHKPTTKQQFLQQFTSKDEISVLAATRQVPTTIEGSIWGAVPIASVGTFLKFHNSSSIIS